MNKITILSTMAVAITAGLVLMSAVAAPVVASTEKDNAQKGLNKADENVHTNTGSTPADLSEQDIRFHQGTCQGGHSTDVLDEITGGGCPSEGFDPGESDEHRQD